MTTKAQDILSTARRIIGHGCTWSECRGDGTRRRVRYMVNAASAKDTFLQLVAAYWTDFDITVTKKFMYNDDYKVYITILYPESYRRA